jgi:hypothetical protein
MRNGGSKPYALVTSSDLRERAAQTRRVANSMSRESDRQTLLDMAAELEAAASRLEQDTTKAKPKESG